MNLSQYLLERLDKEYQNGRNDREISEKCECTQSSINQYRNRKISIDGMRIKTAMKLAPELADIDSFKKIHVSGDNVNVQQGDNNTIQSFSLDSMIAFVTTLEICPECMAKVCRALNEKYKSKI